MPVAVDLELPDGWRAESLQYPMPIRFKTGELSNFGYEGTVLFPLVLHPPEDASKKVTLKASISWLACNDSACVPGEDSCSLVLDAQGGEQSSVADEIDAALKRVPAAAPDTWRLEVVSVNDGYELSLVVPDGLDLKKGKTFPRTPEVVASNAGFDWKYDPENGAWQVTVPRSEYAPTSLSSLEIAIDAPSLPRPVMVRWNAA